MTWFQRIIAVVVGLWLPMCCCQLSAFLMQTSCCACFVQSSSTFVANSDCCQTQKVKSCCDDEQQAPAAPSTKSCTSCVTKAPPPTPIDLDSLATLRELPFEIVLLPLKIEPTTLHATEVAGCWDVPPPNLPLAQFMSANERRSLFDIWLI